MRFKVDILSEIDSFLDETEKHANWNYGVQKCCGSRGIPLPTEAEWKFLDSGYRLGHSEYQSIAELIDYRRS